MATFTANIAFTFSDEDYTDAWETAKKIGELVVSEDISSDYTIVDVELQDPSDDEEDDTDEDDEE